MQLLIKLVELNLDSDAQKPSLGKNDILCHLTCNNVLCSAA